MLLNTISVANFIESKLNELGNAKNYEFKVFDSVGDNRPSKEIKGIIRQFKGDMEPLKNHIDIDYGFVCELAVPTSNANYDLINVREIVDNLLVNVNATSVKMDNGDCLFTFSTATPKEYKMEFGVGAITPLAFTIYVRYTQNAITSYDKHWMLNGTEIPFLKEIVMLEKDGNTNKISKDNYTKALIMGQTKFYKFEFQYNTDDPISVDLQRDILNGDFEKEYTLTYYDGIAFTENDPYTTKVTIFRGADSGVERTRTGVFNVTFTDVDNDDATKYYLALIDTPFDMSGDDTRNFIATADKTAQQVQVEYYESKVANGGANWELIKAPNLNSIDITSQVYRNVNNYELFDLTNKNYAIIKVERQGVPTRYFYYFITQSTIGAGNQIVCDLKLDSIQTYMFVDGIEIADCVINRAHLNRFNVVPQTMGQQVEFNTTTMLIDEDLPDNAKILTRREELKLDSMQGFYAGTDLKNWIKENVAYWVYAYIDKAHPYKVLNFDNLSSIETKANDFRCDYYYDDRIVYGKFGIACYPILKNGKKMVINSGIEDENAVTIEINENGFDRFLESNSGTAYLYNLKISEIPPFDTSNFRAGEYYVAGNGDLIIFDYSRLNTYCNIIGRKIPTTPDVDFHSHTCRAFITYKDELGKLYGIFGASVFQNKNFYTFNATFNKKFIFNKSEIISKIEKDYNLNPKLNSSKYIELNAVSIDGTSYTYDLQKINNNKVSFMYSELMQPEITKSYLRLNAVKYNAMGEYVDGLYIKGTEHNYMGVVSSNDTSLPIINEKYNDFIANNKNFWLQSNFKIIESAMGGGVAGALIGKEPVTKIGGALIGATNAVLDRSMEIDNMRNTPNSIRNAMGNVFFNLMCTEDGDYCNYLEVYECKNGGREQAGDFMHKNGFRYNSLGKVKDYTNIRKYFNFVQAEVNAISGVAMSNVARADFKQRFESGVRFWNSDVIEYEKENYENWLEK